MKLEIDRTGAGFKILGDDGADITKQVPVRAVTVECEVERPTTAIMEVFVNAVTVVPDVVEYHAGQYGRIKGLILEDGTLHYFPGKQAQDDPVDWRAECETLVGTFHLNKAATLSESEVRRIWNRIFKLLWNEHGR